MEQSATESALQPPSAPAPAPAPAPASPKKGWKTSTKVILGIAGFLLLMLILAAWNFLSAVTWLKNAAESAPRSFPKVTPTAAESEELRNFYLAYHRSWQTKEDLDFALTPGALNAFIDSEMEKKKREGKPGEGGRVEFRGERVLLAAAAPTEEGKFLNFEALGEASYNGHAWNWRIDELKVGGKEAPGNVLSLVQKFIGAGLAQQQEKGTDMGGLKLLRREGGKLRMVFDGKTLKAPEN